MKFPLAAATFIVLTGTAPASALQSTMPPIVARAAAANRAALQGAITNDRHIDVAVRAGPMGYTEHNDAHVFMDDGAFVRIEYTRIVKNGHELSSDEVAARQKDDDRDLARGLTFFKRPYDERYAADYEYVANDVPCTCPPGATAVQFHSRTRDEQHGDGTFQIDIKTARVLSLTYTPNVLPRHADQSTITERYGEPFPGLWTVVGIERRYSGRIGIFSGGGVVTETLDHFARVANSVSATDKTRERR